MRNLIKRYVMNRSREKVDEGVTEDDINEIKQDISSFRYELLEILKNNGMTMPSYYKPAMSSQSKFILNLLSTLSTVFSRCKACRLIVCTRAVGFWAALHSYFETSFVRNNAQVRLIS